MNKPPSNIVEAMDSIFAQTFKRKPLRSDSWAPWKSFLRAFFALPMSDDDREVYQKHTGRSDVPTTPFSEAFLICGRRSGKSRIASLISTYLAAFRNYSGVLSPGEQGVLMILSSDKRQSQVIFKYVHAFFKDIPMLAKMVTNRTAETISLANDVTIEIHSSNFRTIRGVTLIGVILDELAFFDPALSANPDVEVLAALRPALATTGGPLLGISSPFSKKGALYEAYREHYGKPSDTLIWKSDSRSMNPTLSRLVVGAAYLRDPSAAKAEFGGDFRDDVENFLSAETIEACVVADRHVLPPQNGVQYVGFTDASGGRADSFSVGIAHRDAEREIIVLDLVHEIAPPFSPENATREVAGILRQYHVHEVWGDSYSGNWVADAFTRLGITYRASELSRSEIYLEALPLFTSQTVQLLDNPRLKNQLLGLERRASRGGRESVDHGVSGHDDLCNSACGAIVRARAGALGGWVVELAHEHAVRVKEPQKPASTPESMFLEQTAGGMAEAKSSNPKIAHMFGSRAFGADVPGKLPTVNEKSRTALGPLCPECQSALSRSGIPGNFFDQRELCGSCGFSRILPGGRK